MGFDTLEKNWDAMVSDLRDNKFIQASKAATTAKDIVQRCGKSIGAVIDDMGELGALKFPAEQKEAFKQFGALVALSNVLVLLALAEDGRAK